MSIPITLGAATQAEAVLAKFATQPAPAKVAYRISKLLRLVRAETAHFHGQRDALIKELGETRPATEGERAQGAQPEITQVVAAKVPEFLRRVEELAAVEAAIAWTPLTMADIEALPSVCADDLIALGPLLDEEG